MSLLQFFAAVLRQIAAGYGREAERYAAQKQTAAQNYAAGKADGLATAAACLEYASSGGTPRPDGLDPPDICATGIPAGPVQGIAWGPDDPGEEEFEDDDLWHHAARSASAGPPG